MQKQSYLLSKLSKDATMTPEDKLEAINVAVIRLEKDMEVMTKSITEMAKAVKTIADTTLKVNIVISDLDKYKTDLNTLYEKQRILESKYTKLAVYVSIGIGIVTVVGAGVLMEVTRRLFS